MQILILHEKHGDRYLDVSTDERLISSVWSVLKARLEEGWYHDPKWLEIVRKYVDHPELITPAKALGLMNRRKDHEYEGFDLETVGVVPILAVVQEALLKRAAESRG